MRLRHIEVFYSIMATGSLRKAAEVLNVSQPAASKVLRHAEQSLGFALFERAGGRLVPTREAEIIIPRVNYIFEQMSSLKRLTDNLRLGRGGHELHIGCVPSLGLSIVPRVIQRYRESVPGNFLTVDAMHGADIVSRLQKHDLDFGIVFGEHRTSGLQSQKIADVPLVLLDATLTKGPVRIEDIDPERWIGLSDNDPTAWAVGSVWRRLGHEVAPAIRVRTHYMAAELTKLGIGSTIVDAFTALHDPELPTPLMLDPPMSVECSVLFREDYAIGKIAQHLLTILREEFATMLTRLDALGRNEDSGHAPVSPL
ncbi:LysR family transcriptional regulator [Neoasaia chiangmaiensis NBRC 101099]|uniref:LysR family transcriptional regulator n=1 Tax=Neoasaia chiangmaiensis TaxID=320497 RepID=A0A1U9KPC3_9PROT|nr:LysR family transcriptional regulator [Neoasaia chiangmaiensis]AQS87658.1 LysR family transcriptional regulator [Neoasaia chiangmaiensis]GBR41947.1 LysR family transcriptional regulator [Neoasaia chiangmaiensis NBRC 101099]GEN14237.1 LysR family transcriptional regulator [Neoasaia chiangmaiensis]